MCINTLRDYGSYIAESVLDAVRHLAATGVVSGEVGGIVVTPVPLGRDGGHETEDGGTEVTARVAVASCATRSLAAL
jgi:hypothetical protein